MTIRVVIVDDQELVRTGFRSILAGDVNLDVVGEASNGAEAVSVVERLGADVVLMDIRMPEMDGLEATRRIMGLDVTPRPRVIILTTFDLDQYVFDALRAGASGFLLKDSPADDLRTAVRVVAQGDSLLSPGVTATLIEEFARMPTGDKAPDPAQVEALTSRELEVLGQLALGRTNAEVAAEIFVAETTVKTHVSRILMKLGLRDRVQAVVFAYEVGLVRPASS